LNTYLHFEIQLYSNQWCSFCRENYTNLYKHKYWFCYCISSKTQCM